MTSFVRPLIGSMVFIFCLAQAPAAPVAVRMVVQAAYLTNTPVLIRVELLDAQGERDHSVWDAEAILTTDNPAVVLSTNRVSLKNGLGTRLLTITGTTDFTLTASVGNFQASRSLETAQDWPETLVAGILPGSSSVWSGVVRITNDVTIPAGHTLAIQSNTLVVLNGFSAAGTNDIIVNGTLLSLGTEAHPVAITCANPASNWGQIRHNSSQPSSYRYTSITKGGRAPGEGGHTGAGPLIRPSNSRLEFIACNLGDLNLGSSHIGKIMLANGSDLIFNDCVFARARMGPEIASSSLLFTNSYILEMRGTDDADGIYIHAQGAGRQCLLSRAVIAGGDDDGIDTLNSTITVENSIIRDWANPNEDAKGISGFHGEIRVHRTLFDNCYVGISTKSDGTPARVFVESCTITGITRGVSAAFKSNATGGNIDFRVTNSIVRSLDAVHTDFGPTNFAIGYCNLSEAWPGAGNTTLDPAFLNLPAHDYRLATNSPCIDAGNPSSSPDPDNSRIDMGALTFLPPSPRFGNPQRIVADTVEFLLHAFPNRDYVIEASSNLLTWSFFNTTTQTNDFTTVRDTNGLAGSRFYRARLAP